MSLHIWGGFFSVGCHSTDRILAVLSYAIAPSIIATARASFVSLFYFLMESGMSMLLLRKYPPNPIFSPSHIQLFCCLSPWLKTRSLATPSFIVWSFTKSLNWHYSAHMLSSTESSCVIILSHTTGRFPHGEFSSFSLFFTFFSVWWIWWYVRTFGEHGGTHGLFFLPQCAIFFLDSICPIFYYGVSFAKYGGTVSHIFPRLGKFGHNFAM